MTPLALPGRGESSNAVQDADGVGDFALAGAIKECNRWIFD